MKVWVLIHEGTVYGVFADRTSLDLYLVEVGIDPADLDELGWVAQEFPVNVN